MKILLQTKALADETRLRLIGVLAQYELNVGEIMQVMGMGQSRISRHLKILMDAGFVTCQRNGLWAFYSAQAANGSAPLFQAVLNGLRDVPEHLADVDKAERILRDRRQSTARFFDAIAADWNRLSQELLGNFDLSATILAQLPACATVADLGCGPGLLLRTLTNAAEHVIGVDNSTRMLNAAVKLLADAPAISLRLGDLEHLPLRDGEADAAIMSMVLHHLAAPQAGIQEMGRVVKAGGHAVVVDFRPHANETLRTRFGDRWLGFSPTDLECWLQKAGFEPATRTEHPINLGLTLMLITARRKNTSA